MKAISHRNGDKIEYTGKTMKLHGGFFYEFTYLDGLKKGENGVTQNVPENKESFVIQIFPTSGNACEHPFARKNPEWAYLTHAVINGKYGCRISGDYLCHDTSLEDQNGLPTCPTCAKKVIKARAK